MPLRTFADLSRYQQAAAQPTQNPLDALIGGLQQGLQLQQLPQQLQDQQLARQLTNAINQEKLFNLQNPEQALANEIQKQLTIKGALNPDLGIGQAPAGLVGETIFNPGAITNAQQSTLPSQDLLNLRLAALQQGGIAPPAVNIPTVSAGLPENPISIGGIQTGLNQNLSTVVKAAQDEALRKQQGMQAASDIIQKREIAVNNAKQEPILNKNVTLSPGQKVFGADGTILFENPSTEKSSKLTNVPPGAKVIDNDGNVVFDNGITSQSNGLNGNLGQQDESGRFPEVLNGLDSGVSATVKGIADYKLPLPSGASLRSPYWQGILSTVSQYDPTFDASQYNVRQKLKNDFVSGKSATAIKSINTVISHLDTLKGKADALGNRSFTPYNSLVNAIEQKTGDKSITEFNTAATAVEDELAAVFKATGATDVAIKQWKGSLDSSQSPQQLNGAINTALQLVGGRIETLKNAYEIGLGKPKDFHLLNGKSQSILTKLGSDIGSIDMLPSDTSSNIKSFKTDAEAASANLPNGTPIIVNGVKGKWHN